MARKENRRIRRRLVGAYASSVISISLVLLLVGVAALLLVNAGSVTRYFKENMQISVILKQDVDESLAALYQEDVERLPFVNTTRIVTRQEGTEDLMDMLGEDFLSVFEVSPVPVSLDLTLVADYVSPDSLGFVLSRLKESDLVDEVECQQNLVDALNANLAKISGVLAVFIALMLFISFVLINNTVRLDVFSRRFTVHTMKLVGATRSFIRSPFMWRALLQGAVASLLSIGVLCGGLALLRKSFPQLFDVLSSSGLLVAMAAVLVCGVLLCVVSTYFVVNKLVALNKDDLYC